jgi:hypothetical protein
MLLSRVFDLEPYLRRKFPSLALEGNLFHNWSFGLRFELGLETFQERAAKLYESAFSLKDSCVVISQDWHENMSGLAAFRNCPVFSLPQAFPLTDVGALQRLDDTDSDGQNFVLQWLQVPARSFSYTAIFEGIANADHAQTPAISSAVYLLNPSTDLLLHMYDDRGLDIIAANKEPLVRLNREFKGWVLKSSFD